MAIRLSYLRELLAELEEEEGDLEVVFPAMITPEDEETQTVGVESIAIVETDSRRFAMICDVYTAEELSL